LLVFVYDRNWPLNTIHQLLSSAKNDPQAV
jgi:hypothetical protein